MSLTTDLAPNATTNAVMLAVARNLTDYADVRIPAELPDDPDGQEETLATLLQLADEYAERAYQNATGGPPETSRARSALAATMTAAKVSQAVSGWARQTRTAAAPAHTEVEQLMVAVLAWRIATQPADDLADHAGHAIKVAEWTAGQRHGEYLRAHADAPASELIEQPSFEQHPDVWRVRAELANRMAIFEPAGPAEPTTTLHPQDAIELPTLHLEGVAVYVHLDPRTGALRIAVDTHAAAPWLRRDDDRLPTRISVDGCELPMQ